ncbi:MAG: hypothetical protein H6822_20130 [Planctomycetaceae bacterium]|nr:hypothetical protein [Planctomycetales bacterium]MCB9924498.1 hypothetical protein [Planctomycetaceae bacterium]
MAKRESQGLQIALILFVMITVVLAVTTFVFFRKAEENLAKAKAAETAKQSAEALVDQQSFWNSYFKHIVGSKTLSEAELNVVIPSVEGDEEMAAVHASYQQDIATYGEGLPQEKLNYRELPALLLQAIRKLNTANTDLNESNNRLIAERDQIRADSLQQIALAGKTEQKAVDDLATAQEEFNTRREELKTTQEKQFTDYQAAIAEKTTLVATRENTIKERDVAIRNLDVTVSKQKETITELRDEPFEAPDGRIAWVNQASRTVWVNLGMADGLRRQTTFSVYDHDAMNVAPGAGGVPDDEEASKRKVDERKGMIEITRVIDQHLSEARIVSDYTADPILPGDQIFSPAWKPGRKVRFALVGFMDIDGDGRSDRDLVRNIIAMGGGVIDAEVHDDGVFEGELSANTRYLVRGDDPDGGDTKLLTSHSNMIKLAEDQGIQEISLLMLLDLMGYKAEVRTVGLGKNADPLQFKAEPEEGRARTSTSGNVSEVFKERRPPQRRSGGGAY